MALTKVLSLCGFCGTGNHAQCVIGTVSRENTRYPGGVVWVCKCPDDACAKIREQHPAKCTECGNRNADEVDAAAWFCLDASACHAVVTARRESDPFLAQIREVRQMAKITEGAKAEKKVAAPKTGTCQCGCAGTTRGGLFLPGHDARFVSRLVGEAEAKNFTKTSLDAGRKALKDAGASDALKAKFEKSAGLAQGRVEKKAEAAKAKAAAKDAAKAEKASA